MEKRESKIDRMGVIIIMAHLIITLSILAGYLYSLASGTGDETLKLALLTIIGYWFGAMGKDTIKGIGQKKVEVKEEGTHG